MKKKDVLKELEKIVKIEKTKFHDVYVKIGDYNVSIEHENISGTAMKDAKMLKERIILELSQPFL
jgi:hypothetical protein